MLETSSRPNTSRFLLYVLIIVAIGFFGYLIWGGGLFRKTETLQTSFQTTTLDQVKMVTVLPKDAIQAIKHPRVESAAEGAEELKADEQVIGISINGEHRAYPLNVLSVHEIVDDVVGGKPVAVTY